jgi:FAD/FMN-containing dehydrogenase
MTATLEQFAADVGPTGAVVAVGGRTQWHVGGPPRPGAREVRAPSGVVSHLPAEMIVRARAATPVAELDGLLATAGQMVPLDPGDPERATVGGVLAVGHSGVRRLRYGPVRDTVLEVTYVSAEGRLVRAGAPVVKNVSGFDLCRLLVGSLGTLGLLAEVVLRVQPLPPCRVWVAGASDPAEARRLLFRPSCLLWDGATTWVLLEGHASDVHEERSRLGPGFAEVAGPPAMPSGSRLSVRPRDVAARVAGLEPGSFLAEVGVGTIHLAAAARPAPQGGEAARALNEAVRARFDPEGRLNPGRRP